MTLQETLQVLGGVSVIASLIFVAIQIRNNSRAVRAATYQQLTSSTNSIWMALAGNGELAEMMLRGHDDFDALTRTEKTRVSFLLMAYIRKFENAWFQHKVGTLKQGDWKAIAADMDGVFANSGTRALWPLIRNRSSPQFAQVVDGVVDRQAAIAPKLPPGGPKAIESPATSRKKRRA